MENTSNADASRRGVVERFDEYENDVNNLLLAFTVVRPQRDSTPAGDFEGTMDVIKTPDEGRCSAGADIFGVFPPLTSLKCTNDYLLSVLIQVKKAHFCFLLIFQSVAPSRFSIIPRKLKGEEYGKANEAPAFNNPVDGKLTGWIKADKIAEA